jgi:hypothetical protein
MRRLLLPVFLRFSSVLHGKKRFCFIFTLLSSKFSLLTVFPNEERHTLIEPIHSKPSREGSITMKKSIFIGLLTMTLLLGTASVSWGYGVFGATDLMYTPTANSLDAGSLGISVDLSEGDIGYFNFDYGLFSDLEMGIVILTNPRNNIIRFRGKFKILQEDRDNPGLALGIEDLGSESNSSPYLVLSKAFPGSKIHGHIGVGGGNFDGIFGGISVFFTNGSSKSVKQAELFLEADSWRTNAGAKLKIASNTKINFAMTDLENWMAGVTFLVN